jgi:hypothetical protein
VRRTQRRKQLPSSKAATEAVNRLFRPDYKYNKAEVLLVDLQQPGGFTEDLFAHSQPVMADEVMSVLDEINGRWGKGSSQASQRACSARLGDAQRPYEPELHDQG